MLNSIFERLYFVKIGPISGSSAFLHFKKDQIFLLTWSLLGKNQPNFVYPILILHNQSHAKWWRVYFSFCLCNPAAEECQHFWAVYFLMDWNISWWQNDIICQNLNVYDMTDIFPISPPWYPSLIKCQSSTTLFCMKIATYKKRFFIRFWASSAALLCTYVVQSVICIVYEPLK